MGRRRPPRRRRGPTVFIKDGKQGLRFVAPKTIVAGEDLTVLNTTNPTRSARTPSRWSPRLDSRRRQKARQLCFTPKATSAKRSPAWHGVKGNGPVTSQPGRGRRRRLGHVGSLTKKGDSWFTGEKPNASFTQPVTADTAAGPTTIYFMCAIHPWMHGSIEVLPGELAARLARLSLRRAWGAEPSSAPWAAARWPRCCRFEARLGGAAPARGGDAAAAPARSRSGRRLPIPRVLRGSHLEIPIREAEVQVLPGAKTRMWTYGGTFPGPTIRRPAGQRTKVTFHHELPADGGRADRPPARRPQPHPVRRPAGRADRLAPDAPSTATSRAASRRASRATTC